jgi:hypothetical protein
VRQGALGVAAVMVLAVIAAIAPVGGQIQLPAPAHNSIPPVGFRLGEVVAPNPIPPASIWEAPLRPAHLEIAAPLVVGLEPFGSPATAPAPILPAVGGNQNDAPHPALSAQLGAPEWDVILPAPAPHDPRSAVQAAGTLAQAPAPQREAAPPALKEPFTREVAKCDQASGQSVGVQVAPVLTFTYTDAANPATAGGTNYTGPGPGAPQVTEPGLELCITATPVSNVSLFLDLTAKAPSDSAALITIERLYLELRNTLGARDLRFRVGRDRFSLGPLGLLLNEVDLEDQRDGFELWLPAIGPVRLFGFYQYALVDRSTTRRLWGGRAEAEVFPGWTLGVNYRADTAAAADVGPCPSSDCATGSGFGVDLEGKIAPGLTFTLGYASYTQTDDVARAHYQAELAIDLKDLAGIRLFEPVLAIWYKNFDPYTIPGQDGTVPRGSFLTPDDFKLFNINDNLTAVGAGLELQLSSNILFLLVGEWGTYKDGGPAYSVYLAGLEFRFPDNIAVKLTYNAYTVAGGSVTTSPVSGIELSNATVYQIEVTKAW